MTMPIASDLLVWLKALEMNAPMVPHAAKSRVCSAPETEVVATRHLLEGTIRYTFNSYLHP
jgi:hypothetical protein